MCGVGAIFLLDRAEPTAAHQRALESMGRVMAPRGPDAQGVHCTAGIGLVHRRLSILDPDARSNQPMESESWILSYNGEIYNHKDVRRELERTSETVFRTTSDTEVLLYAIERWGVEGAIDRCAGMFAFVAFDKRNGSVVAVRDRLGIKPLLMTRLDGEGYAFASSVSALTAAFPERRWKPCVSAIASYCTLGACFTTASAFEGIERVGPGHLVRCLPDGRVIFRQYWQPRYRPEFQMEELLEIVGEYETADVPSALFLSGGVDSTFLCAATRNLDCFHLTSPETEYASIAARRFERRFVVVKPNHDEFEKDMARSIAFHGEPMMSSGIPAAVCRSVREHGYKMAISANGADELFHGYHRTPTPGYVPDYLPLHELPSYKWLSQQVCHIYRDRRNFRFPEFDEFVPDIASLANDAMRKYHLPDFPPSASHRWFELMTYVLHDLNPTLDAASMLYGLEVRVPFLDHRIVEGVLSWTPDTLVTPTLGRKSPLKAALADHLAPSFFHRPKLGFSIHGKDMNRVQAIFQASLTRFARQKRVIINKERTGTGEFDRDMSLLGSICKGLEAWESHCVPA